MSSMASESPSSAPPRRKLSGGSLVAISVQLPKKSGPITKDLWNRITKKAGSGSAFVCLLNDAHDHESFFCGF